MAGSQPALVGRSAELERLGRVLGREPGGPRILEVAGEPGIGKTRFLTEVCHRARCAGDLVLSGRAADLYPNVPFGVFADAMDGHLATLPRQAFMTLEPEARAELATAFPTFEALGDRPAAVQAERYRTCRAVRSLLEDLSAPRPLTLVLDDVHWADAASIDVLLHLLAYPPCAPVLVVVAFRPAQTADRLARALATATRDGIAERLHLDLLTAAEANQLLGPEITVPLRRLLYAECGGNPFYLEQLLRGIDTPCPVRQDAETPSAVPATIQEALEAELARLPPPARRLLDGASVAGDPFDIDLAAMAAGLGDGDALRALDVLVATSLCRPAAESRQFRFRHPIVRRAVYERAGEGWRIEAHGRVASALAALGAPASARAHHVEHSARPGDEEAMRMLVEAARASTARSPAAAAHWYGAALRLLPPAGCAPARLELLAARALALAAAGQIEESHQVVCSALEVLPAGAPGRLGLVAFCARLECLLGKSRQARRRLEQGLREVTDEGSAEAVGFQIELCAAAQWADDSTGAEAWSKEALHASRRLGDPGLEATASAMHALTAYDAGRVMEAAAAVHQGGVLLDGMEDGSLAGRLEAPFYLCWAANLVERFDEALRHAERAIAVSRSAGEGQWLVPLLHARLWPLIWTGALRIAEDLADEAVEAALIAADMAFLPMTLYARCLVAVHRGDVDAAVGFGERAVEHVCALDRNGSTSLPGLCLGMALIEAGQPERARTEVLSAAGGPDLPFLKGAMALPAHETLVRAEISLGRLEAAEAWAGAAERVASRWDLPLASAAARRSRAAVLISREEPSAAADLLARAVDAVARRSPLEAGRTRLLAAHALAAAGDGRRALVQLDQAQADFALTGACGYAVQAADLQRTLRGAGQRSGGLGSLSPRERQVAELVAAGRTNREIAATCHLSEKTVERHLSHIFTKLGTPNRARVAAIVAAHAARLPLHP